MPYERRDVHRGIALAEMVKAKMRSELTCFPSYEAVPSIAVQARWKVKCEARYEAEYEAKWRREDGQDILELAAPFRVQDTKLCLEDTQRQLINSIGAL